PFIGTGGHGHTYPGASAPFGMMQLSPDTRYDGWDGCGGYHYSDSIIYGFSHTHLSGTGVSDYADLLITPQGGKLKKDPLFIDPKKGYGHKFSHEQEEASPGFYSVFLPEDNIQVRLTTDIHSGMHEYTFKNKDGKKQILLDLDYRDELLASDFNVESKKSVSGYRISNAWATEQHFYFFLETNIPFLKAKRIKRGGRHKVLLIFPDKSEKILLKVGISAVDVAGAKNNLATEIPHFNFETTRNKVHKMWQNELSRITFHSTLKDINEIFYSSLYHTFLVPNEFSDTDGKYRGMDNNIHTLKDKTDKQYTVFSLWDTFRGAHPLYTLIQQDRTNAFIRTFIRQDAQQNDLPVWELAGNETECMIGYHSVSVIADAYLKGLRDYDADEAFRAMVRTSNRSDFSKNFNAKNGFVSLDIEPESVSKALEYSYDDFCIAQMAKSMGNRGLSSEYNRRAMSFINHFDSSSQFFRARRSGMWMGSFRPEEVNFNYTEANAWQYSLFAPHAIGILDKLHRNDLEGHLNQLFEVSSKTSGRDQADITGLIGQYAHGNEPSHHMAYLFNYVNRPDLTQKYVDSILFNLYQNEPDGLSGNEDCGQMSSWYVLSSMGLYPMSPGRPYYEFGRPICHEATLHL
ncbi:MAG: putative alpha-1,2-mannosidase, partial [Psychromonas sp.]